MPGPLPLESDDFLSYIGDGRSGADHKISDVISPRLNAISRFWQHTLVKDF